MWQRYPQKLAAYFFGPSCSHFSLTVVCHLRSVWRIFTWNLLWHQSKCEIGSTYYRWCRTLEMFKWLTLQFFLRIILTVKNS